MIIVVVVILVVLVGAGAAWWFLLRQTPEQAIEQFMAAAEAQDVQKARSFLSQESLQAADELQKQAQTAFVGMMPGGDVEVDLAVMTAYQMLSASERAGKAKVEGNTATIPMKAKGPVPMGVPTQPAKLVKEGGEWKLDLAEQLRMAAKLMGAMPEFMKGMAGAMQDMGKGIAEGMGEAIGETAVPAEAKDAAALVAEATAAKRAGKLDEAASKYRQALAKARNNADAHWGLAWVLAGQKKNAEAVGHFQQVIKLSDDQKKVTEAKAAIERLK